MSRRDILASLKANAFKGPSLPSHNYGVKHPMNLERRFTDAAKSSASQILSIEDVYVQVGQFNMVVNFSKELEIEGLSLDQIRSPYELEDIDLLVIDGVFGVSENGAIWVETDNLPFRVLPFIAEHLVICIKKDSLVSNMHDAYANIKADSYEFGVFIGGPSKTADIEQSLVIGAQGPRSLGIVVL